MTVLCPPKIKDVVWVLVPALALRIEYALLTSVIVLTFAQVHHSYSSGKTVRWVAVFCCYLRHQSSEMRLHSSGSMSSGHVQVRPPLDVGRHKNRQPPLLCAHGFDPATSQYYSATNQNVEQHHPFALHAHPKCHLVSHSAGLFSWMNTSNGHIWGSEE